MSIPNYFFRPLIRNISIGGVILAALSLIFISHVGAASSDSAHDGRLVTFHDRGEARVILTHAETVRDALSDAHISVVKEDSVEPALDDQLVATDYTINIYRARPVIVVDGPVRTKVMTAAQTPEGITAAAGITLHDEDRTKLGSSTDTIMADGASVTLTVERADSIILSLYGTTTTVYTRETTVGKMLASKDIHLQPSDSLSVDPNTSISPGMTVAIWRNGVQTATATEDIDFPIRLVQDVDQPVGYHQVQTAGTKGHKTVTYEITMQNGKEVSRKVIQSVVIDQPKEQVEVAGAALPPGSHQDWMLAAGMAASNYGFIDYIFTHESHWNPASRNPSGLYVGLGQTSPAKLSASCPNWAGDPICQIHFFNSYAVSRYGSWQAAYTFKKNNGWW
jgi:uncharacterized protein YabE (DUF348 family)